MRHLGNCGDGACECYRWPLELRLERAGYPCPLCNGQGELERECDDCGGEGWVAYIDVAGRYRERCRSCDGCGLRFRPCECGCDVRADRLQDIRVAYGGPLGPLAVGLAPGEGEQLVAELRDATDEQTRRQIVRRILAAYAQLRQEHPL